MFDGSTVVRSIAAVKNCSGYMDRIILLSALVLSSSSASAQATLDSRDNLVSNQFDWFEREVRPLLAEHCYACHASSLAKPKGGLTLDSREGILTGGESGPAAVPGKPAESLLVQAIRRQSLEMPPSNVRR